MEQVDTPVAVGNVAPEQSTRVQSEAAAVPVGDSPPSEETILRSNIPIVSNDVTTILPVESSLIEPDSGPSTSTATPELAKPGVAEAELTEPLHQLRF